MADVSIEETCACGAKLTARGDSWGIALRQESFHKQHAGCRKPEPGICGDPQRIEGPEPRISVCHLRAGHAGFHEDGQGCSWGRPRWYTRAGDE